MPTVVVSAKQLVVPVMCLCCGGPPTTNLRAATARVSGQRIRKIHEKSVEFPVCARCLEHERAEPVALNYAAGAAATLFLAAPAAILMYREKKKQAAALRMPSCEAHRRPVEYQGWHGTEHTFWFDSPRFAQAFVKLNRAAGKAVVMTDASAGQDIPPDIAYAPPPGPPPAPALPPFGAPPGPVASAPAFFNAPRRPAPPSPAGRVAAIALGAVAIAAICCMVPLFVLGTCADERRVARPGPVAAAPVPLPAEPPRHDGGVDAARPVGHHRPTHPHRRRP